ncbi:MAG: hypothetical protein HC843_07140 [Sphingomonadales bacterium]|nr:hypothetical protein [Sphingomonadales bacterium]
MSIFIEEMLASFPTRNQPPEEIVKFFHWIDKQGLHHNFGSDDYKYADIDPDAADGMIGITPVNIQMAKLTTRSEDPIIYERFAEFCSTGGDGSRAALWLDDDGQQHIVHMGSGSGSTLIGIMVSNPIDFLRTLAIGYSELCWPSDFGKTPEEVFNDNYPDAADEPDEYVWPKPLAALQKWVATEFGVSIPKRADQILLPMADMDDVPTDPFHKWIMSLPE